MIFKKVNFQYSNYRKEILNIFNKSKYTKHFSSIFYFKLDCIICIEDEKVIGVVLYHIKKNNNLRLRGIAVDSNFYGKGIAKKLLYKIPRKNNIIEVSINIENNNSIKFFNKNCYFLQKEEKTLSNNDKIYELIGIIKNA